MNFVIDADIAMSAGESKHPISSTSRKLLEEVSKSDGYVCYCKELSDEWKKHNSYYAKLWRTSMVAKRRQKMLVIENEARDFLLEMDKSKERDAAIKDSHLIDLAIKADKVIFSNDKKAKAAFSNLLDKRSNFKGIYWISPSENINDIIEYALKGKLIPNKHEV